MREAFEEAAATLAESERCLARPDRRARRGGCRRNQLERAIRDLAERKMRFERQISEANRELSVHRSIATLPDPAEKREAVEAGECRCRRVRSRRPDVEQAWSTPARPKAPSARAGRSGTLAELNAGSKPRRARFPACWQRRCRIRRFSPGADMIRVDRGYETALGAALGDDLESPLDPQAPAHWSRKAMAPPIRLCPKASAAASDHALPNSFARRLAQIGLVSDADGAA
jgi:chromosome segregation protein